MTRYYKTIESTVSAAGEVVAACEARNRRQAERYFGINDGNAHLYEVIAHSRVSTSVYDPHLLVYQPATLTGARK